MEAILFIATLTLPTLALSHYHYRIPALSHSRITLYLLPSKYL